MFNLRIKDLDRLAPRFAIKKRERGNVWACRACGWTEEHSLPEANAKLEKTKTQDHNSVSHIILFTHCQCLSHHTYSLLNTKLCHHSENPWAHNEQNKWRLRFHLSWKVRALENSLKYYWWVQKPKHAPSSTTEHTSLKAAMAKQGQTPSIRFHFSTNHACLW